MVFNTQVVHNFHQFLNFIWANVWAIGESKVYQQPFVFEIIIGYTNTIVVN